MANAISDILDEYAYDVKGHAIEVTRAMAEQGAKALRRASKEAFPKGRPFALLFEIKGDKHHIRRALYNCTASRPAIDGKNEENKSVQTEKLSFEAIPLPKDGLVKGDSGDNVDATVYANWFSAVYLPSAAASVARLSALSITGVTLTPAFSAYEFDYAAVTTDSTNVVTATGADSASVQLLVNGESHTSGSAATWSTGINTVVAIATKTGCEGRTYTINVTKTSA